MKAYEEKIKRLAIEQFVERRKQITRENNPMDFSKLWPQCCQVFLVMDEREKHIKLTAD